MTWVSCFRKRPTISDSTMRVLTLIVVLCVALCVASPPAEASIFGEYTVMTLYRGLALRNKGWRRHKSPRFPIEWAGQFCKLYVIYRSREGTGTRVLDFSPIGVIPSRRHLKPIDASSYWNIVHHSYMFCVGGGGPLHPHLFVYLPPRSR